MTATDDGARPCIEGVDLSRLKAWMDDREISAGPISKVASITGGTQNILIRFVRGGRSFVLRRPPLHKRSNSDEVMRREMRVLTALGHSDVPHPRLIAGESDAEVMGAAFYLMEPVDGFNPTEGLPPAYERSTAMQREMGFAMVDSVANLSRFDFVNAGLGELGRLDGWADRQVPRWQRQLHSYGELEGYPGPDLPELERVSAWLGDHAPSFIQAGLVHGDFHFSNVIFSATEPRLLAIVDWELATLGDPLIDFGHLLATWPGQLGPGVGLEVGGAVLPTVDELIERYCVASGRDPGEVLWFRVLACFRLGVLLEGTYARSLSGAAPKDVGSRLHEMTLRLFALGAALIA